VKITLKSGEVMDDVVALAKGLIGPADLAVGGALLPKAATRLIQMVFATDFLAKITTEMMTSLKQEVSALDMARRQMVRVPQGNDPDEGQFASAGNFGCVLTALPVQLFPSVTLDTLRNNRDNPEILSMLEESYKLAISRDLVDLGFNGVADDNVGATREAKFIRLNTGWLQIARTASDTKKADIDPAVDGWKAALTEVVSAADPRALRDSVLLMNPADADDYFRQIAGPVTGSALIADSAIRRFEGRAIEGVEDMPRGKVLFTPLKNLVHGIHVDIKRDKAYHQRKRALEFTFDMAVDFEIAVKSYCVIGE
jgi:hypothetical protein